ncbi:DUF4175 domain-containing protein [Falsirhodobacter xinxiangensis]|uniref:DUF4175 domain-containing protein n=1 Tax=Falsirhodobacter xinxiangensis TaxID=2530049 RepID=UPI0010AA48D4|nr:DUF4175 domain-containing protein [Rhodobacter xinxiangensis]
MTESDQTLRRLAWPIRLTLGGLWAERLLRAFWPLITLAMATLAVLAFGLQDRMPLEALWAWLVLTALGGGVALVWGVRQFRRPRRADALARLDAALPGRPISALSDTQAIGVTDPASQAVWAAHRQRMAERATAAKAVRPDLQLASRDPFALRYLALTALVVALIFGSLWRVTSITGTPMGGAQVATGPTWEAWVQPPAHTGKPSLYLNDITAASFPAPVGSRVQIRLYGEVGDLTVAETVSARTEAPTASEPQQEFQINRSGSLSINGAGGQEWQIIATPDAAPTIGSTAELQREPNGEMRLPFEAGDDYGVTAARAEIALDLPAVDRRFGLAADPEPRETIVLDLPLPITGSRTEFSELLVEDLSQHPFANLPVTISLSATDGAGQTGASEPMHVTLPGRRFFDPLAAALIEMRRDLLWTAGNAARTDQVLKALTHRPEGLFRNERAFLRLRVLMRDLAANRDTLAGEKRDEIAAQLWDIALLVEEGDLASAMEQMRRAQDRLDEAIRNGADPSEIEELMQELREATDNYIRELAEQAQRNPDQQQTQEGQQMQLSGQQLQDMMDQLQKLMEEGKMAEAAELMEMMRQLMENLQVTQGPGGSGGPGQQAMRDLQDTLRGQQGLSDESFDNLQRGDGQGGEGLAQRQRELQDKLNGLDGLPGQGSEKGAEGQRQLDRAGRAMEEAERALRDGDLSGALDKQAEAMDAMREGMRNFGEAMAEEQGQQGPGGQPNGEQFGQANPEGQRDPLGREPGESGRIGSDRNMLQGEDIYRRAEELLDEIRRRSGEQQRPSGELDYLRRLLDLF